MSNRFQEAIKKAADSFRSTEKKEIIRVVSHLDSDGICSGAILLNALDRENRNYSLSIVPQLNENIIRELANEDYNTYFFTDLGSGQIDNIKKYLKNKKVFILDHHLAEEKRSLNIENVNPHFYGIDGSKEISGSGVVYLFAKELNDKNKEMAHIAVIGAIGDMQEVDGFSGPNKQILDEAIQNNKIDVKKGLKLFGMQTRPLHKALEYSTEPVIPGVTGSESNAIEFLHELGINPKHENNWKKAIHLTKEEMKKLVSGIILKRVDENKPEDIFGNNYIIKNEKEGSPLKDAREFSTLLNACGRLNKASYGIGACLGDKKTKIKAINCLTDYKKEIINALNWYDDNKNNTTKVITNDKYIIINAEDNVLSTIIGTMASILSNSRDIEKGTYILSMAQNIENNTKISLRISGHESDLSLKDLATRMIEGIENAEAGGHTNAAGAIIPTEKEEIFLKNAKEIFDQISIEEKVVINQ